MKKEKGVAIENPSNKEEEEDDEEEDHRNKIAQSSGLPFSTRNASSKYDFVKVLKSGSNYLYFLHLLLFKCCISCQTHFLFYLFFR